MKVELAFLLATLGVVFSAPYAGYSMRVCIAAQWEASHFSKVGQLIGGQGRILELYGVTSTDYVKKMIATTSSIYVNGKFVTNNTVLASETHTYVVDLVNKTCTRVAIPVEIEQICSDSKFLKYVTSWTIGGIQTDTYDVKLKGRETTITFIRDDLIPVTQTAEEKLGEVSQMVSVQYGNFTTGIQDPSIFDIPSFCFQEY